MKKTLTLGDISAIIIRKPIRHMYVRVLADTGSVEISAPLKLSLAEIEIAAQARLGWIVKQLESIRGYAQEEGVPLWGKTYELKIIEEQPEFDFETAQGQITIRMPRGAVCSQEAIGRILDQWRKILVLEAARPMAEKWMRVLDLAGVSLKCRRMKSRWGTCYPDRKQINLNSMLACKPIQCLELVLVHEFGHFFERGHGSGFKYWMSKWLPDWKEREKILENSI